MSIAAFELYDDLYYFAACSRNKPTNDQRYYTEILAVTHTTGAPHDSTTRAMQHDSTTQQEQNSQNYSTSVGRSATGVPLYVLIVRMHTHT